MDGPQPQGPAPIDERGRIPAWFRTARSWIVFLGLGVLPIAAAIAVYYRPVGTDAWDWQLKGDQVFYGYQMARAAETGGRWWEIPDDHRLGWPYQSSVAKHSGLFEGVDLLLLSSLTARLLDPAHNYHFLVLVILAVNGWIAGWLVRRWTRSVFWAAVAMLLITWNEPTALRLSGHLHLFKYGWTLLAVWAFARYLDAPSPWRGLLLGLAVAWVLQGSFYTGYFLVLTLATWFLGCLVTGRLNRRHVAPTALAALAFVLTASALTFPVWAITRRLPLADQFAHHPWKHTWYFSSEPWQWLVSRSSPLASRYVEETGAKDPGLYSEGGSFPGYTVLAGIAVYAIGRLRGLRFIDRTGGQRFLDVLMGQVALLVVLSLTGGASFFLHDSFPSIRCYGRSGSMGLVGLGCVAAPVCLHGLTRWCRYRLTRGVIVAAVAALVAYDGTSLQRSFSWLPNAPDTTPAWVDWLARQPARVKLAAFGPIEQDYWYGTLSYALRHGHTTLNGCDFELLNADLNLLGAAYHRMNQEGLRFVASLGFETLAVHRSYLETHPWIRTLGWLERRAEAGDWLIYGTNSRFQPMPAIAPAELLRRPAVAAVPAEVPSQSWITGQLDLDRTVVLTQPLRIELAWADAAGRLVSTPRIGLYQHVFGPNLPAYTIKTPMKEGAYQLVFLDERRRTLGAKPFVVSPQLLTSRLHFRRKQPDFTVSGLAVRGADCRGDRLGITLENKTSCYIQAHTLRDKALWSASTHPGMAVPSLGSLVLQVTYQGDPRTPDQLMLVLPRDLPAHGRLALELPIQWRDVPDAEARVFLLPMIMDVGQKLAGEHLGEVALSLDATVERTASKPAASATR
jgi:hypothetical protein